MRLNEVGALIARDEWVIVAGLFDPLTAVQATRLTELAQNGSAGKGRKLLALVLQNEESLLSADARAALVAALREVHLVAIAEAETWRAAIRPSAGVQIVDDTEGEKARSAEFIQFIFNRQGRDE